MALDLHEELCFFFLTNLSDNNPLILGLPWLQTHNPDIDWLSMTLAFTSKYCRHHCLPWDLPKEFVAAVPTVPDPPRLTTRAISASYRPPSVEDYPEDTANQPGEEHMDIETTLTPGRPHYQTHNPSSNQGPERRAMMIPNQPRLRAVPTAFTAGRRRCMPPPAQPPLPKEDLQQPPSNIRPDMSQIRMAKATNFVQFCRDHSVQAMTVTWDELDNIVSESKQPSKIQLPDLSEDEFQDILLGKGDWKTTREQFPDKFHDFIDECYDPIRLGRLADSDIEKFLKGKPTMLKEDILRKLPFWLNDLNEAFLPQPADQIPPHRSWDHKIELMPGKEPPYSKNRPLSSQELQVVRKWLDENLTKGFIRESRARCAAPLMLAAKPGGGVRICQDYRGLNNVTIKNRYPLPLIRETLDALCNAKFYTKLDIIAAFNRLRIAEGHEWKTAFTTRFGLFETLVMPFGLCNAPASFQHYINHTLYDLLDKICTAYLDDILIYSKTRKEHREHVRQVVVRLRDAGLQIDINKCEFETTRTKYLGLIITPDGIEMDPAKVDAILSWEAPTSVRDLQKFLGFANFYRRFIKDFSRLSQPLNNLLKKGTQWQWGRPQQLAFSELKLAFSSAPTLAFFDYNRRSILETDASDWASGGILSQYDDEGCLKPVAYFSSKHTSAECNYEIYDKELLAIIKCLEEWLPELQGTQEPFEVITDHKNLQYFMTTKALNQRQVRWSEFLSQFNFRIIYRPGNRAIRPDALSRKKEHRPDKTDPSDDRLKNRERVVLPADRFESAALESLLQEVNNDADAVM